MNLLTNGLPAEITVLGEHIPVHVDFRRWILFIELFGEDALPPEKKLEIGAKIVLKDGRLRNNADWMTALCRELMTFAACGEPVRNDGKCGEPVFDFSADGDAIFAGFWQTYGIDLTGAHLHWFKFNALLRSLPPETEFMRRIGLRTMDLSRIEDDGVRKKLRQAKARVRLRQSTNNQQKEESLWQTDR